MNLERKIYTKEKPWSQDIHNLVRLHKSRKNSFVRGVYTKLGKMGYKTTKEVADAIRQGKIKNRRFLITLAIPRSIPLSADIVTAASETLRQDFKQEISTTQTPKGAWQEAQEETAPLAEGEMKHHVFNEEHQEEQDSTQEKQDTYETKVPEDISIPPEPTKDINSLLEKKRANLLSLLDSKEPTHEHLVHVMDQALINIDDSRNYALEKMTFLFSIGFQLRDNPNIDKEKVRNFINKISY